MGETAEGALLRLEGFKALMARRVWRSSSPPKTCKSAMSSRQGMTDVAGRVLFAGAGSNAARR
jgi:hypothetical protein